MPVSQIPWIQTCFRLASFQFLKLLLNRVLIVLMINETILRLYTNMNVNIIVTLALISVWPIHSKQRSSLATRVLLSPTCRTGTKEFTGPVFFSVPEVPNGITAAKRWTMESTALQHSSSLLIEKLALGVHINKVNCTAFMEQLSRRGQSRRSASYSRLRSLNVCITQTGRINKLV